MFAYDIQIKKDNAYGNLLTKEAKKIQACREANLYLEKLLLNRRNPYKKQIAACTLPGDCTN